MRILVTGATGFIGRPLVQRLAARGDRLTLLSRNPARVQLPSAESEAVGALPELSGFDAVVNLAGEPLLGRRWNEAQKARIARSRLEGTARLVEELERADPRPAVLVSASAVGYYGDRGAEILYETSEPATGYLGELCRDWEASAEAASALGVRVVLPRIGVVLGLGGGALAKMLPLFRSGLGGPLASGRQWMSWIHRDDLVRMILFALDTPAVEGPLNGTAPGPVTNRSFTSALARAVRRPAFLPAPAFGLRLLLGEAASVLLASQRCAADRAIELGFHFAYPELSDALTALLHEGARP